MYQRSSLQGPSKPSRPRRAGVPRNTAFITRKRDKSQSPKAPTSKPENLEKSDENVKIPSYLSLLLNLIYFPLAAVYKVYSVVAYIFRLPGRILEQIQYLCTLPPIFIDYLSKCPAKVITWICRNLEGLLQLCIDYQIGGILCFAAVFWLWPLPDMTYPLFAILRLVLGTLYPAYASFKAVRTKNVREYVSTVHTFSLNSLLVCWSVR